MTKPIEALTHIEWHSAEQDQCPWCGNYRPDGHRTDCQRQIALGLAPDMNATLGIDIRTCQERQDDALAMLEAAIENLERRIAALEAQRSVRMPIAGTVIWDTGQVTWGECYVPQFLHRPGYPAPEEAS